MLPHFSHLGFSYNSGKRSSENPLEKLSLIPLSDVSRVCTKEGTLFMFWVMPPFPVCAQPPTPSGVILRF